MITNTKTKSYTRKKDNSNFSYANFWKNYYIIPVIFLICIIGIITAGSAIQTRTFFDSQVFADEFFKQIVSGFLLGLILAYSIYILGIEQILKFRKGLLIACLITLFYLALPSFITYLIKVDIVTASNYFSNLPIKPIVRNGAVRWLSVGFLQFQPVEVVKISILLYMSHYFREIENNNITWEYIKRPFYVFAITSLFILVQPDLGSVVIITLMLSTVLFLTKINIKQTLAILTLLIIFSGITVAITPYRRERFLGWLNNSKLQETEVDYLQIEKVQKAIQVGGLYGVGYTKGEIKNTIPEVSSDAVLAVLGEEFGSVSIIVLIALYSVFFYYCLSKAKDIKNTSKKMILIGVGSWIFYQAVWNIGGVIGLVPMKGLPLPFISEGSTSVAISILGVGLILACLKKDIVSKTN